MRNWAIIDAAGLCVESGRCPAADLDANLARKAPPPGGAVVLDPPADVGCFEPWRFLDGVWRLDP